MKKLLLCMAVVLVAGATALAGDWAHWRGPEQNGISRETGLVDDWSLETKKNVLWISPIGGRATPIVMNGRIYLDCRTPHDVADPKEVIHAREQVVCRDAETGDEIWRDELNVFQTDVPAPRVGWASMVGDPETGHVYLHSVSGIFRCYTPEGIVAWEYSLHEEYGKVSGYGGRTVTPVIDEDRVIVGFFGTSWGKGAMPPPRETYYAFDKRTGKLLWTSAPGGPVTDTNYYTIQADVMMRKEKGRLPSIGVTAHRYNLILKGNTGKLSIQTWPAHTRMAKDISFRSDPNVWYTAKLRVDVLDDGAHVRGKAWQRGQAEPDAWTIEAVDPHPNLNGSPGLYVYTMAPCYYDNVIVTKEVKE